MKRFFVLMITAMLVAVSFPVTLEAAEQTGFPSRYDLRDDGFVTPVKYQNPFGSCWAFGAASAMESSILSSLDMTYEETVRDGDAGKEGAGLDISEKHLTWFGMHPVTEEEDPTQAGEGLVLAHEDVDPNSAYMAGGNNGYITTLLSSGVGPLQERSFPYKGREGFTQYEYFLAHLDDYVKEVKAEIEDESGKPFEEFIDEQRENGGLEDIITTLHQDGVLEEGVTAENITCDMLAEAYAKWENSLYEECDEYSILDDWSIDLLNEKGEPNRILNGGYVMKNGNILPDFFVRDEDGHWSGINEAGSNAVKQELMNGRGIVIRFYADQSMPGDEGGVYINTDTWAHYTYEDGEDPSHTVCIVGWDDNYSKENFLEDHRPPGDGAWIAKNNWGSQTDYVINENGRPIGNNEWGLKDEDGRSTGYFYISYYDKSICFPESMEFSCDFNSGKDFIVLQYDYMPASPAIDSMLHMEEELKDEEKISTANVFVNHEGEDLSIRSVSAKTGSENTRVTFEIYRLEDDAKDPTEGKLLTVFSSNFQYKGFHRVNLDMPVEMKKGDRIAIVETGSIINNEGKRLYEYTFSRYGNEKFAELTEELGTEIDVYGKAVVNKGESYIMKDGAWHDWSEYKEGLREKYRVDSASQGEVGEGESLLDYADFDNFGIKLYAVPASTGAIGAASFDFLMLLGFFVVPVIMLIVGIVSSLRPKKKINGAVGYRTRRSMASQEAWDYAQELMGKYILFGMGIDFAIGAAGVLISLTIREVSAGAVAMAVVMLLQIIPLIAIIPIIEGKLKERFGDGS